MSPIPQQARLSRRGRSRLKREPALTVVAERDQEAVDPPFDAPDVDDIMGEHEAELRDEADALALRDMVGAPPIEIEEAPTEIELAAPLESEPDAVSETLDLVTPIETTPLELVQTVDLSAADDEKLRAFAPSAMRALETEPAPAPELERRGQYQPPPNSALKYAPKKDELNESPVPPISIFASWDRPDIAEQQLAHFAADRHLARAEIEIERGGLDAAVVHCAREQPDLLIIDTTLGAGELLAGLDRLARVIPPHARLIIIGAVNDVGLLRELAARGVAEYIVPPARRNDLIRATCRLFADAGAAKVFAVIGARGGVGASTLAQNLAWSIAERQQARTALIDLDLPFGAGAFALGEQDFASAEKLEASAFQRANALRAEKLELISVSEAFKGDVRCDEAAYDGIVQAARRMNSFVVLDVPHEWNGWVKRAVTSADETIIIASPDLAALRNAEGMLRQIKAARSRATPLVALSMVGLNKRCEISRKDFVQALGTEAVIEFAFEPELFGLCAMKGQLLSEVAPKSKAALDVDALAIALTGRSPVKQAERQRARKRVAQIEVTTQTESTAPQAAPSIERQATQTPPTQEATEANTTLIESVALLSESPKTRKPTPKSVAPTTRASDQPDLIRFPLTFKNPGESGDTAMATVTKAERPDVSLVSLQNVAERAIKRHPPRARRALRIAAMTALLLQASVWTWEAHRDVASAAEPARVTPRAIASATQPISATANPLASLQHAAEIGSATAQYDLAQHYRRGDGVAADPIAALQWTERAAVGGHCMAMYDLGVAYAQGDGAPRDDAAAFRWFRQAAEYDVADGQYNLGLLYQQGVGVSASMPEALFWFLRAAQSGDGPAAERAAMLEAHLPPTDVEQAEARMRAFQPQTSALSVQCAPTPASPAAATPDPQAPA